MQVKRLQLKNFRNYGLLNTDFSEKFNIIYGNNAQGKTNLIEAIFLCASGRSHRTSRDDELVSNGAAGFEIKLELKDNSVNKEIHITYSKEQRKKVKINEVPIKRIGDLMGHLNAVMFSPEDLMIIKQGPAERRRFIDITLSQLKPSYFFDLQQYQKILFQRNCLLKKISIDEKLDGTLDVWNRHLVNVGSRIMKGRKEFVKKLNSLAAARHKTLTNNEEQLELNYNTSFDIDPECFDSGIEEIFLKKLSECRDREILKGSTLIGPHRDDMDIVLDGVSTKIYGSQGQQRTTVLSMKLAEIDLIKQERGEYPVLLLDDVLSELDDKRKEYLLDSIEDVQTFITCTDKRFFKSGHVDSTSFIYVENGKLTADSSYN